jgi:hypothetical protein
MGKGVSRLKGLISLALILFCHLSFMMVSNVQTRPNKNQLLPYDDADGYQVLSAMIDA